ncbi:3-keto-5-aminohexanoate cleavage protein [Streptomyces sp. CC0208]|uniref:3-keto-5-aminohexanoate cleavage protein n=1 Tax=Streptomyces sp. CC0208 TaxID=2306165 RepID=UPI000E502C5F|nr:3-keto-5-aminohexanoate cleavage protein [Streptomyces sp. CC0208]
MVQVCLNGPRGAADGTAVPLTPESLAQAAAEAVAAGATDIHVHPKTPCGQDSLSPRVVAATLEAIRARVSVPVGVTTGAWAEPDPTTRLARVRSWTVLPDHASVNWHEPGAEETAAALIDLGIGVEAGIWSGTDAAARFAVSPLGPKVLRVLAEVTDTETAEASARALLTELGAAHGRPVLLHGEDGGAWPVLRLAGRLGLATRIGLEDTLVLPEGQPALSNAQLVAEALVQFGWSQRSS